MASGYTYEIRLRDLLSRGLAKAGRKARKFYRHVQREQKVFNQRLSKTPGLFNRITASLNPLRAKLGNVTRLALKFGLAFSLVAAVKSTIALGSELEQTRITYQTLLKDATKGNKLLSDLNSFANATPFKNRDIHEAAKLLLNYGVSGQKIIPVIKRIGTIAGPNAEKMRGIALAYGQVMGMGRLQGQDHLQLVTRGFNVLKEISRTSGESMATLTDKMREGGISAQMVEQAFVSATSEGGMFHGMLEKQAQTMGGKWSTFMGKLQDAAARFGEKLAPLITKFIDFGIVAVNWLPKVYHHFKAIPSAISENIEVIGALTFAYIGFNLQMFIAKGQSILMTLHYGYLVVAQKLATIAQWNLNAAFWANPIGFVIGIIALLVGAILWVRKHTEGWAKSFRAIGTIIKTVVKMMWADFKFNLGLIGYALTLLGLKFKQFGQWINGLFQNIGKAISLALQFDFDGAKAAISAPIVTAASAEIEALDKQQAKSTAEYLKQKHQHLVDIATASKDIGIKMKEKSGSISDAMALNQNHTQTDETNITNTENTTDSVVTGGKKTMIVNIQIDKVIENIEQHISDTIEDADELVDNILDGLTRRLAGTTKAILG